MRLLTKELEQRFASVGSQESASDPIIIAKFFNPTGAGSWFATEYNPEERCFFGYVTGLGSDELGYFSLDELTEFTGQFGLGIERDLFFGEKPLSAITKRHE